MNFWLTTSGHQALCLPSPGIKLFLFLRLSFLQPFMSPRYPGGPRPSLRMPNQPPGSIPGSQPLLPNSLDPTRPQGTDGHRVLFCRETLYWLLNENLLSSSCMDLLLIQVVLPCQHSVFYHRTSKHGRSNENESPPRHGRHGPTGKPPVFFYTNDQISHIE